MELNIQGEYFGRIDERHRVKLPAKLVEALGEFMIAPYKNNPICLVPVNVLEEQLERLNELPISDMVERRAIRTILKAVTVAVFDVKNRLLLPPELCKRAGLTSGDKICIVGMGDHAEIRKVHSENE